MYLRTLFTTKYTHVALLSLQIQLDLSILPNFNKLLILNQLFVNNGNIHTYNTYLCNPKYWGVETNFDSLGIGGKVL